MTSRRIVILIALASVLHNILRVVVSLLGAPPGIFNYLRPFAINKSPRAAEIVGLVAIAAVAIYFARAFWRRSKPVGPAWISALSGAGAGAALGLLATFVMTVADHSYALALFVAVPFLMGFVAAIVRGWEDTVALRDAMLVSTLSVILLGGSLIAFALEGFLCLIMALPVAIPLALMGAGLGYLVQRKFAAHGPATFLVLMSVAPFGGTLEAIVQPRAELFAVTTSIDIPVAPERVWSTVLQPATLAAPTAAILRAGIAYPLASHIEGSGSTATRYCDFSTGKLVEPVLIWKERSQLRFTVVSNPLPMQEWTPYARIHPPHLEGFLASRQGEFLLAPLPNGGTRLAATTWYQHHMWPAAYWRIWSDYIIHRVHDMVLANIRERALRL